MAYGRKYGRKRSTRRRFGGRKRSYKRSSSAGLARKAYGLAKKATRILRGDRAEHLNRGSTQLIGAAVHTYPLTLTETGDGEGERDGEALTGSFIGIKLRYAWSTVPPAYTSNRMLRVMLVREKDNETGTAAIPPISNFLDLTGLATNQTHLAGYDRAKINGYDIMYDKVWTIIPTDPFVLHNLSFKTPYIMKYRSFTALDDYAYTNRVNLYLIPCGELANTDEDGLAACEFSSRFVFFR